MDNLVLLELFVHLLLNLICRTPKCLPNNKILDRSKLKALADIQIEGDLNDNARVTPEPNSPEKIRTNSVRI